MKIQYTLINNLYNSILLFIIILKKEPYVEI